MTRTTPTLALRRFEPGMPESGPPVLLVHGFTTDGERDWVSTGWPDALAAAGRPVLVPDLPGHGSSPAPATSNEATVERMVRALAGIIQAEAADGVDVVGYSLGARLAWELPRVATGSVHRLVLGGISPRDPFAGVDVDAVRALAADPGEAVERGAVLTATLAQMISAPGMNTEALALCIEGLGSQPFAPNHGDVGGPALFVAGEADPLGAGIEDLAALVPGSQLLRVPGDHVSALRGEEFREATLRFLTTI